MGPSASHLVRGGGAGAWTSLQEEKRTAPLVRAQRHFKRGAPVLAVQRAVRGARASEQRERPLAWWLVESGRRLPTWQKSIGTGKWPFCESAT